MIGSLDSHWTPSGGVATTGFTASVDFPTTAGAQQSASSAGYNAFVTRIQSPPATLPGDYDGNGKVDLIWTADATRQSVVWFMTGGGGNTQFNFAFLNQTGLSGWTLAGASDFNGDGCSDLVWMNDITRQVVVWYMSGNNCLIQQGWAWLNQNPIPGWTVVGVADFNHDGIPDLLWENEASRQVVVWYTTNTGPGGSSWAWVTQSGVPAWSLVAVGDFNHDGTPDLVWQNDSTRQAVVWYMGQNGTVMLSWEWLSQNEVPGWTIAGVADFNFDGNLDLLWYSDRFRQALIWYMLGPGTNGQHSFDWVSQNGVPGWRPLVPH